VGECVFSGSACLCLIDLEGQFDSELIEDSVNPVHCVSIFLPVKPKQRINIESLQRPMPTHTNEIELYQSEG
jgi:hypothetical protein